MATAYSHLRGITRPPGGRQIMTEADIKRARALYRSGATLAETAAALGVSIATVRNNAVTVAVRPDGVRVNVERLETVQRMRREGASLREIGDAFRVSHQAVAQQLRVRL